MEIGVPSRFACLNIEDEDLSSAQNSKPKEVKKKLKKPAILECSKGTTKKLDKNVPIKKIDPKQDSAKQTTAIGIKKGKKKPVQQWEDWKQKDDELENGLYEEDLRSAILLSKLDYEHNKEVSSKQTEESAKEDAGKKGKKNKTISLDKFLNHVGEKQTNNRNGRILGTTTICVDTKQGDFFNSVDSDTKTELKKEQVNAKRKKREININEVISSSQHQEKFEEEHRLRLAAEQEVKVVKAELTSANLKIQSLCHIISEGQVKDKAAILLENQQLNVVKNDLTESITNLHALLEKERSKVASLSTSLTSKGKQKDKKRKGN